MEETFMIYLSDKAEVERAIERNNPEELLRVPIILAMNIENSEDRDWAEDICIRLSSHENETIRGNSILSFGHIARISKQIKNSATVIDIVKKALDDGSEYVRGHAVDAADDLRDFLGWKIRKPRKKH
jgi:hypothetical protein